MDMTVIALAVLVAIAASGIAYVVLFPRIEVEKRQAAVSAALQPVRRPRAGQGGA